MASNVLPGTCKKVAATGIVQLSQVVRFNRISRSKRLS
eukprot:gene25603-63995_t